jgi:diguanylate cyclase (GGDEF)-like protein
VRDEITARRPPVDVAPPARSAVLAWLVGLTAAVHAVLAAAGFAAGGGVGQAVAGAVVAVVGAGLVGLSVSAGSGVPVTVLNGSAAAVLALAGAVSGLRAAGLGGPWAGADVVLPLMAAIALPTWRLFLVAVAGAEATWTVLQVVGAVTGTTRPPAYQWVLLAVLALGPVIAAAVLRFGYRSAVDGLEGALRTAGQRAVTDPLTGVTNRRGLELMALPMIEHARRQGEAAHCLFIDLDGFRAVNDTLGRESGDEVLTAVCESVLASVRATDVVARWAGDQFVVIGPGTGTSPLEMERRVRSHLTDSPPVPQDVWDGRVSIGSATLVPWDEGDIDSLLHRAEEDMRLRRSLRRQSRSRLDPSPSGGPADVPSDRRGVPKTPPPVP